MFRRLLTHLVILPLLLPQGVCVCDFFSQECAACAERTAAVAESKPDCRCSCCNHRPTKPVEASFAVHTCTKYPPNDGQDRHAPGCPAKNGGAVWKTEPASPTVLDCLAIAGAVCTVLSEPVNSACSATAPSLAPSDQPLYITLLTLRI